MPEYPSRLRRIQKKLWEFYYSAYEPLLPSCHLTRVKSTDCFFVEFSISCNDMAHTILHPDSLHSSAECYLGCKLLSAFLTTVLPSSRNTSWYKLSALLEKNQYVPLISFSLPVDLNIDSSPHRTAEAGADIVRPI